MGAAHDDRESVESTPSTDVSETEAEAVASNTSADQIEDLPLVAPTDGAAPRPGGAAEPAGGAQEQDDAAEPGEDRRQLQQGSGQASPSFGEQQQRVPPAS